MQLVPLGMVIVTDGAADVLSAASESATSLLERHQRCDWGDMPKLDKTLNDSGLAHGESVMSAYNTTGGRLWVLTNADRTTTKILKPVEA